MWFYLLMFFIQVIVQITFGLKTNNWGCPTFLIVSVGVFTIILFLNDIYKEIKKKQ